MLSRDQLDVIEAATGVTSSVVEALTLSVYDGVALQLDPILTVLTRHSPLELCRGRDFARNACADRMGAGS